MCRCEDRDSIRMALYAALDHMSASNPDSFSKQQNFVSQIWEGAGEEALIQHAQQMQNTIDVLHNTLESINAALAAVSAVHATPLVAAVVPPTDNVQDLKKQLEDARQQIAKQTIWARAQVIFECDVCDV